MQIRETVKTWKSMYLMDAGNTIYHALIRKAMKESMSLYHLITQERQKNRKGKVCHFFIDDYQFQRLWSNIDTYVPMLQEFDYVLTPDFSLYLDYPKAIQIYNHYRKHWVGAYMQMLGIKVIPTIAWSDKESFNWCFDGEPEGGTVAVSSVGCMKNKDSKKLFIDGYKEMISRLHPETIIFYGGIPDECKGNIVRVKAFTDKFKEAKCNGW